MDVQGLATVIAADVNVSVWRSVDEQIVYVLRTGSHWVHSFAHICPLTKREPFLFWRKLLEHESQKPIETWCCLPEVELCCRACFNHCCELKRQATTHIQDYAAFIAIVQQQLFPNEKHALPPNLGIHIDLFEGGRRVASLIMYSTLHGSYISNPPNALLPKELELLCNDLRKIPQINRGDIGRYEWREQIKRNDELIGTS